MKFITRLSSAERNELTYWLGLAMLFVGLAWGVSVATALIVCGAGMALVELITSYLNAWLERK